MENIKDCSNYEYNNFIKNDNQIIKLLNELKNVNNILIDADFHSYKELKNINLLIELNLKFDYSIKDNFKRVNKYCLQEKELIKNILNIIKNNNFSLEDPLEKNDNYIYLVLKKNKGVSHNEKNY